LKVLVLVGSFVVIFFLSIPLHEFFHILAIKILGRKWTKIKKINWFGINLTCSEEFFGLKLGGKVESEIETDVEYSQLKSLKRRLRMISLSGGLGMGIVLVTLGCFFLLNPVSSILGLIWLPFLVISGMHLIKGVLEDTKIFKEGWLEIERQIKGSAPSQASCKKDSGGISSGKSTDGNP